MYSRVNEHHLVNEIRFPMVHVLCRSVKLGAPTSGDNSMNMNDVILIDDEEDEISQDQKPDPTKLEKMASNDSLDSDSLPDLDADSSIQSKSTIVKAAPAIPGMLNNLLKTVVPLMNFI